MRELLSSNKDGDGNGDKKKAKKVGKWERD
jgi:hypothetical protein